MNEETGSIDDLIAVKVEAPHDVGEGGGGSGSSDGAGADGGGFGDEPAEAVDDLRPVKETPPAIDDRTRAKIATQLTWAVMLVSGTLALLCAVLLVRLTWNPPAVNDTRIDKVTSLVTILLSQTLYPLTTIAVGWYFASRQIEGRK